MSLNTWITVIAVLCIAVALVFHRQIADRIRNLRKDYEPQDTEEQDLAESAGTDEPDPEFVRLLALYRGESGASSRNATGGTGGTAGMSKITRLHLTFWGKVQGVGFRYQAMYAAKAYNLTGWIENEPDGSVEMEVQGPEDDIGRLVTHLRKAKWIRILSMDVSELPVKENDRSFRVLGY